MAIPVATRNKLRQEGIDNTSYLVDFDNYTFKQVVNKLRRPFFCIPDPEPNANPGHRWELLGNYPVFTVVMVVYHYVERIWRILVTPIFLYNIYDH